MLPQRDLLTPAERSLAVLRTSNGKVTGFNVVMKVSTTPATTATTSATPATTSATFNVVMKVADIHHAAEAQDLIRSWSSLLGLIFFTWANILYRRWCRWPISTTRLRRRRGVALCLRRRRCWATCRCRRCVRASRWQSVLRKKEQRGRKKKKR